jgi:UDP-2,4-diacetamido-2,4,6-trideoxy-beta-L-altropyranose hydrolase
MSEQASHQVTLRRAVAEDCRRLWEWRNEQATREASFNTEYIAFEEHERWFLRKLPDPQMRILIAEDSEGHDIGYIRFDIRGGEAEISVSVDENQRGKGYGATIIKMGSDYLLSGEHVKRIIARIKHVNPGSVFAFERAGFTVRGYMQIAGVDACEMVYEGKAGSHGGTGTQARISPG